GFRVQYRTRTRTRTRTRAKAQGPRPKAQGPTRPMPHLRIFLSAVTREFKSYRDELRAHLARPNVSVHIQEDFIATGGGTLDKLDDYIRECDAVIHLAGDMT